MEGYRGLLYYIVEEEVSGKLVAVVLAVAVFTSSFIQLPRVSATATATQKLNVPHYLPNVPKVAIPYSDILLLVYPENSWDRVWRSVYRHPFP